MSDDGEGLLLIQEVLQPLSCAFGEEKSILQRLLREPMYPLSTLRYLSFDLIRLIKGRLGLLATLENDRAYLNGLVLASISWEARGLCVQDDEVLRIAPCLPVFEVAPVPAFFLFADVCQSLLARLVDGILCLPVPQNTLRNGLVQLVGLVFLSILLLIVGFSSGAQLLLSFRDVSNTLSNS